MMTKMMTEMDQAQILDQSVDELSLSTRVLNVLTVYSTFTANNGWQHNYRSMTIRQLIAKSSQELLREPHFGRACLLDVREKLAIYGLYLRDEDPYQNRQPTVLDRLRAIDAKLNAINAKLDAIDAILNRHGNRS